MSTFRRTTVALACAALVVGAIAAAARTSRAGAAPGPTAAPPGHRPWVTGYYAAWFWDSAPPDQVDMTAMTHFVFGRIAPGGGTLGGMPGDVVFGGGSANNPGLGPGAPRRSVEDFLVARAHAAGTKALVMLGGVGDKHGFARSTEDPAMLTRFVKTLVDYLVAHDYDGVDVDWEDGLEVPANQAQLVRFLVELRSAANARARYRPPNAPVTITFPGYPLNINTDLPVPPWKVKVASLVDQYNLMSYSMAGMYEGWKTWIFSAIDGASGPNPYSLTSSIDAYVAAGVPRGKLGIGIGFYGMNYAPRPAWAAGKDYAARGYVLSGISVYQSQAACTAGLTAPSGRTGTISDGGCRWTYVDDMGPRRSLATSGLPYLQSDDTEWTYAHIARKYVEHGTYVWDEKAQQGYLLFPNGYTPPKDWKAYSAGGYLSYEDERSIAAKGAWVRRTGVGGTILWTLNYDYAAKGHPLLAAVKRAFLQ